MNIGDHVYVTADGKLRILPQPEGGQASREQTDRSDQFVGVVQELRDDPEDAIVALESPTPNTAMGRSTIRTLRDTYIGSGR
jgi:hypothetical protein